MKVVDVYTDGACSGNPGAGGYCAILIYNGFEKVVCGRFSDVLKYDEIYGLEALKEVCKVNLYSDSQYVVDAFNQGWINSWQLNGWRTANKKEVKNVDLWQRLLELNSKHQITFIKVKGHADNEYNNRCDKIAVEEYKKLQNKEQNQ